MDELSTSTKESDDKSYLPPSSSLSQSLPESAPSNATESTVDEPEGIVGLIHKAESSPSISPDYTEFEGDMIIWPDSRSYSEELLPEFFIEAFDDEGVAGITTKDELIAKLRTLIDEQDNLLVINHQLQTRAMNFLQRRKVVKAEIPEHRARLHMDYEVKYSRYLAVWELLLSTFARDEAQLGRKAEKLQHDCEEQTKQIEIDTLTFLKLKKEQIKGAVNSQTGEKLSNERAEYLLQKEKNKMEEVNRMRAANFNLKYRVKKRELAVHSKEGLAGGHHMYDFEQLKIENQAYNEKIEERNEELSKFRRKIMNTIQMVAHIKEKVHFTINENEEIRKKLSELDAQATKKREILAKTKQVKDKQREEKSKLQHKSGLLGKKVMLRDFRLKQDKAIQLTNELTRLKVSHYEYLSGVRRINKQIKFANRKQK